MKKIKLLLIIILISLSTILVVNAATDVAGDCHPAYDWNWTVTENCNWPDWYKVFGNIIIWQYTITMLANDYMWIDLSTKKITFTTWKINLDTTAKIENHVSSRYYISVDYVLDTPTTACPTRMYAFYQQSVPTNTTWYRIMNSTSTVTTDSTYLNTWKTDWTEIHDNVASSWTIYCWTRWS